MYRVGFIVPQRFQLMSLAALTAFEIVNLPRPTSATTSICRQNMAVRFGLPQE
jgi:hypothetical protein